MTFIRNLTFVLAIAAFCCLSNTAVALDKVGTTSMQILKLPMGVRGLGMGNAMVATAQGAETVWWNVGALTTARGNQVQIAQINLPADIQCNTVSYAKKLGEYSSASLNAVNLFTNDMKVRTVSAPEGTGEYFNAYDVAVGAAYAQRLTDKFSLGGQVRYLHSSLEEHNYDGMSVDLGTLYQTALRSLKIGMTIQNLGPDVKYSGTFLDYREAGSNGSTNPNSEEFEGASLPTMFRLGFTFDVWEMFKLQKSPDHSGTFALEMDHPNDNKERLNVGGEYSYRNTLFVRSGGKFGYDEESFALGLGLRFDVMGEYAMNFDYAYSHWGRLTQASDGFMDQPHRFAVSFAW